MSSTAPTMLPTTASTTTTTFFPDVMPSIPCHADIDCSNISHALCPSSGGTCRCPDELPVYIADVSGCLKKAALNTSCLFDEQCLASEADYGRCGPNKICTCVKGFIVSQHPNVGINCVRSSGGISTVDPAMIGVLVGLALMFIIICVVLRLFSKARFRETRSIFNTPNPRLMNASLFKDSKLLSPARGERRGSRASVRAPSRTASLASVNAAGATGKSPNGSLATKGRRGSAASTASGQAGAPGGAGRNSSPGPGTPKAASTFSPTKDKKEESSVAIEAVD